jgi:hypothetical protein
MGVNNDYAGDVLLTEEPLMMEDSDEESVIELDPQSWQDFNSEELLNTYFALEEYHQANGIYFCLTFPDFCNQTYSGYMLDIKTNDATHLKNVEDICQRGLNNYRDY